jgi:hypothetical protein
MNRAAAARPVPQHASSRRVPVGSRTSPIGSGCSRRAAYQSARLHCQHVPPVPEAQERLAGRGEQRAMPRREERPGKPAIVVCSNEMDISA